MNFISAKVVRVIRRKNKSSSTPFKRPHCRTEIFANLLVKDSNKVPISCTKKNNNNKNNPMKKKIAIPRTIPRLRAFHSANCNAKRHLATASTTKLDHSLLTCVYQVPRMAGKVSTFAAQITIWPVRKSFGSPVFQSGVYTLYPPSLRPQTQKQYPDANTRAQCHRRVPIIMDIYNKK